jgi:hypothetical protein
LEYIGDFNLKSSSNRYISDDGNPNRPVRCWEKKSRNEEKWRIYLKPGTTKACLLSDHGFFLRSYQDGTVRANSLFCARNEEWEMVELPDDNTNDRKYPIALRALDRPLLHCRAASVRPRHPGARADCGGGWLGATDGDTLHVRHALVRGTVGPNGKKVRLKGTVKF